MARPREPRGPVRAAGRPVEPGQLRRPPAGPRAPESHRAGAGRRLGAHRRGALLRARRAPPAGLVRGRGDPHGPAPALRTGHSRRVSRARHRHHRHDPPRGGGPGDRGPGEGTRPVAARARDRGALVRRLPPVDDHRPQRHRGEGGEEQPRHLLGDAGGRVRAAHRERGAAGLVPRALQDRPGAGPGGRRRQLPARNGPHEALRVLALQPRGDGHRRPAPLDPGRRPVALRDARTGVACAARSRGSSPSSATGRAGPSRPT